MEMVISAFRSRIATSLVGAAFLLTGGSAFAQGAPPPGANPGIISSQTLNRQQEEVRAVPPVPPAPDAGPAVTAPARPPAPATPASNLRFTLTSVTFGSSKFLSPEALQQAAAPYVGHEVGFADLDAIVHAVNALYDARGLVTARALLAPQAISGGVVHIDLIEGKIGKVQIQGARHQSDNEVLGHVGLATGNTIDVGALRHRLSLLNRTTDTQARLSLQPGEQFGLTDIQLSLIEPRPNVLQLIGDNYGYDSAGRFEGALYYRRTGLIGASDRATGYFSGSAGALSGSLSYDAPILGPTSRLGASYGISRTNIVYGPFAVLKSQGVTQSWSVNYSQPLASSEFGLLLGSLSAGISNTRNYVSNAYLGNSRTHRIGAGLTYSYARPGISLDVTVNGLYANAPIGGRIPKADFGVFSGTAAGEVLFGPHVGVRVSGGWQAATVNGVSSDQLFQIGGATTVRGYRQGELTGDGGYFVNGELEMFPLQGRGSLTLFAFVDQGRVMSLAIQPKSLTAVGGGFTAGLAPHLSLRVTVGVPLMRIGEEPRVVQAFGRLGVSF